MNSLWAFHIFAEMQGKNLAAIMIVSSPLMMSVGLQGTMSKGSTHHGDRNSWVAVEVIASTGGNVPIMT